MTRVVKMTKQIVKDELYLFVNGVLFYKRWLNTDKGRMFYENEGLTQWARGNDNGKG